MRYKVKLKNPLALIAMMIVSAIVQAGQSQRFIAVGDFSNYQFTEEHQYGAQVKLWREGTNIYGLFSYSAGVIGDTPSGLVEKISFQPATGQIAFSARLTMGLHSCRIHKNIPSRELFSFDGVLSKTSVVGTLRQSDELHPELAPTEEKVVLKKLDDAYAAQYRDHEQWQAAMEEILRFRGPKW